MIHHTSYAMVHRETAKCSLCGSLMLSGLVPRDTCRVCEPEIEPLNKVLPAGGPIICNGCPSGQACARWGYCNAEAMREGEALVAPDTRPSATAWPFPTGETSAEQQIVTLIQPNEATRQAP